MTKYEIEDILFQQNKEIFIIMNKLINIKDEINKILHELKFNHIDIIEND